MFWPNQAEQETRIVHVKKLTANFNVLTQSSKMRNCNCTCKKANLIKVSLLTHQTKPTLENIPNTLLWPVTGHPSRIPTVHQQSLPSSHDLASPLVILTVILITCFIILPFAFSSNWSQASSSSFCKVFSMTRPAVKLTV